MTATPPESDADPSVDYDVDYDWAWTQDGTDWLPPSVDPAVPSVARIYDYFLGGKDNFAADRTAAECVISLFPDAKDVAKANRGFLIRAVEYMAQELGIRQFVDLGTGIPTSPSVHETARRLREAAKVVYVDFDPVVLAHSRALLSRAPDTATLQHDLREPGRVLKDPTLTQLLDLREPVGLLLVAVLHFVDHDIAPPVLAQFIRALAPGSAVVITAASRDGADLETLHRAEEIYARSNARVIFRTGAQIEQLFEGLDLVAPGVVDVTRWRSPQGQDFSIKVLGGVGIKR